MTVTTSKGKTYAARWMWGPVGAEATLMLELNDPRPLWKIAREFEGVERFERRSEAEGDLVFEGYTAVQGVVRPGPEPDAVRLTLRKGAV